MATFTEREQVGLGKGIEDTQAGLPSPDKPTLWTRVYGFPWWGVILLLVFIWAVISISSDELFSNIFRQLRAGIGMTLQVSAVAYLLALIIGLVIGTIRSSKPKPQKGFIKSVVSMIQLFLYNIATLYVEVMRGLPVLIVLLIGAFVILPTVRDFMEAQYGIVITFRSQSPETAIIGLALTYGAFLSEVFRAGIQSVDRGQIEAARSLGMTYMQTMRLVVLPQAIRRIIPPLGNDFVAMIKDSSLVAFLGIRDVTQLGKIVSGSNFRYMETYFVVATIYLTMTVLGSLLVKFIERRMSQTQR